jgi:hypothetical protein
MNQQIPYKMVGAPLPQFCARCGLTELNQVHHGHDVEWSHLEKIPAHKFIAKETR